MNESSPFKGGQVLGADFDPKKYRAMGGKRGDKDFIMSRSELMLFYHCPSRWIDGYKDEGETDSTEFGSLLDCLLTTPEVFTDSYALCPETYPDSKTGEPKPWNFNANYCKEWREQQGGKAIIKADVFAEARAAKARFLEDETNFELIECSRRQVCVLAEYVDEDTGISVIVKILLDLVPDHEHPVFGKSLEDLKTARSAHPAAWARQVFDNDYHIQGALYFDAYTAATGEDRTDFRHLVVENYAPYEFGRRILSSEFLTLGRDTYLAALQSYCQCLKHDWWPGYDDAGPKLFKGWSLTMPEEWMTKRINERLEFHGSEPTTKYQAEELLA